MIRPSLMIAKPTHTVQLIVDKNVRFDTAWSMHRLEELILTSHLVYQSVTLRCEECGEFLFSDIGLYV